MTGGTQGGMIAGFKAQQRSRKVVGIDASARPDETWNAVAKIARATAKLIGVGQEIGDEDVILERDYAAPTYGIPSAQTLEAIRLAARLEGMITDPVYEGKSMQGLIDLVQKGYFPAGSRVLYAHLGGVPAINGYSYIYRNG